MGCKCKEDSNKLSKFTDNKKPVLEPLKGLRKVLAVIFRTILGIFLFSIVIIAMPFAILYVIFVVAFGGKIKINLKKLFKLNVRK